MEAEDKIALSQKEDKEKKFKDYEQVITKNFKNTMQIFKRNVKEINWEKQTKLIYLVTLDESQQDKLMSKELQETHKTSENFQ